MHDKMILRLCYRSQVKKIIMQKGQSNGLTVKPSFLVYQLWLCYPTNEFVS